MSAPAALTIRAIRATPVDVPMRHVLGTSQAAVRSAPLLLVDLETGEGITGHSYLFCYVAAAAPAITAILGEVERQVKGARVAPADLWAKLAKRFTLIGVQGVVRMAMEAALDARASDYVMPDLERIGGVTGWQRAAGLAAARGIETSTHLFPEVSAHLLAATPTGHWLEYVDWAAPLLEQPLEIVDGFAVVPERPGNGLSWNLEAVERYRMR